MVNTTIDIWFYIILDIGEIYTVKKSSIYNNFETSTRISGQRVQVSKIDFSDEEMEIVRYNTRLREESVRRKLYENCLDYVNYFQTQNELDDIKQMLKNLNIKKVFVYYRANNDQNFSKVLTKLVKVRKDLKRDDFCIIASNNLAVLRKEVYLFCKFYL